MTDAPTSIAPTGETADDGYLVDYTEHFIDVHGVTVHVYEWRPEGEPKAVIHISHGAGEHGRRYQDLARDLIAAGYAVVTHDHLGHGRTGEGHLGIGDLGEHGMRDALRIVRTVIDWVRSHYRGLPLVGLGHSWGSLMGQKIHGREPELFDLVVWSGTTIMLPGCANPGNLNEPWDGDGTGMSWLTRDQSKILINDRFGFDIAQSNMLDMPEVLGAYSLPPVCLRGRARRIPLYIVGGTCDTVSYGGRGARLLAWWYRHVSGMTDVTLRLYEGARHEVFKELNSDEVIADLVNWLDWHLVAPAALGR